MPTLKMERAAGGRVAGVDEAGRGPLAGPVVAAAVVFGRRVSPGLAAMLDDFEETDGRTAPRRVHGPARLARRHRRRRGIRGGNPAPEHPARLDARHAPRRPAARPAPDLALVDGNYPPSLGCPVQCVVGGDALCLSIAAASIVAKVVRDRAMARLGIALPRLRLGNQRRLRHDLHRAALDRLGATRHHREAFGSVAQLPLGTDNCRLTRLRRHRHDTRLIRELGLTRLETRIGPVPRAAVGPDPARRLCAVDAHVAVRLGRLRLRRPAV